MIRYSIIIPHYNSFLLLRRCLDSIPKREAVQVIVVDDNSDKKELLDELRVAYPHVHVISLLQNGGGGKARNEGLRIAQGKWILFADADDYFEPDAYDIIDEHYDSKADVVYFEAISRDSITGENSDRAYIFNTLIENYEKGGAHAIALRYRHYVPWSKMIKRDLIMYHYINFEEIRYSNDIMFSAQVGYFAKLVEVDRRPIYCITTNSQSLTRSMDKEAVMCRYEATLRYNAFLKQIGAGRYRAVLIRYLILGLRPGCFCVFRMIKKGLSCRTNFLAGLNRWRQFFDKRRRQLSHF